MIERRTLPDPAVHGADQAATIERLDAALQADAAAFGAALPAFPTGPVAAGEAQLARIAARPADPRITTRLLALLRDPPYRTRVALPWWLELLGVLEQQGDPRTHARLGALVARIDQLFAEPMRTLVGRAADATLARLAGEPPPLDAADEAALSELEAHRSATSAQTLEQLEAAIYAAPDDEGLRMVYADACLRAGDPRGELISLQSRGSLTGAQRVRLKQLVEAHRSQWLGPLERVLLKSSIRLEAGFLDAATLKPKHTAHLAPLIGDRRWATVRHLTLGDLGSASDDALAAQGVVDAAVLSPAFRRLRQLDGAVQPVLAMALARDGMSRGIERLEVLDTWPEHRRALRASFDNAPGLPALSEVTWRSYDEQAPGEAIVGAPLLNRLRSLSLSASAHGLAAWIDWWATTDLEALRLSDVHDHRELRLERHPDGLSLSARFRWPGMVIGGLRDGLLTLCEAALEVAPGTFTAITLRWTRKDPPRPAQRAAIERMLAHLEAARVSVPRDG